MSDLALVAGILALAACAAAAIGWLAGEWALRVVRERDQDDEPGGGW